MSTLWPELKQGQNAEGPAPAPANKLSTGGYFVEGRGKKTQVRLRRILLHHVTYKTNHVLTVTQQWRDSKRRYNTYLDAVRFKKQSLNGVKWHVHTKKTTHEGWISNAQRSFNARVLLADSQIGPHQVTYDAVAWPMHI